MSTPDVGGAACVVCVLDCDLLICETCWTISVMVFHYIM